LRELFVIKQVLNLGHDGLILHVLGILQYNFGSVFEFLSFVNSDCIEGMKAVIHAGIDITGAHDGKQLFA
jgi:hypothetical protein